MDPQVVIQAIPYILLDSSLGHNRVKVAY